MKELKGFKLIELNPGESTTVEFEIDNSLLEFYTYNKKWSLSQESFNCLLEEILIFLNTKNLIY